jgi:tyrosine-protein phosphatase YwqE
MTFQAKINDNIAGFTAFIGERLGTVAGYISTRISHENMQEKILSTVTVTMDRVGATFKKIDTKSADILSKVSSMLNQLPGKTVHTVGEITKQANDRFNETVQNSTYYLIDFAHVVKSSVAERKQ